MTHQPLRITATLATGIAHATPWGIALDGLLAAQLWEQIKDDRRRAGTLTTRARDDANPPDLDLPLARCTHDPQRWHWAATVAFPDTNRTDVRSWLAYTDPRPLEQLTTRLPNIVSPHKGRYRTHYRPLPVTVAHQLRWHAIGDLSQVTDLLTPLTAIGKKRAAGEGQVLHWTVEPAPDLNSEAAAHLHPDGSLGRPCPNACLEHFTPTRTSGHGLTGLRPPYMHPSRLHELELPTAGPA